MGVGGTALVTTSGRRALCQPLGRMLRKASTIEEVSTSRLRQKVRHTSSLSSGRARLARARRGAAGNAAWGLERPGGDRAWRAALSAGGAGAAPRGRVEGARGAARLGPGRLRRRRRAGRASRRRLCRATRSAGLRSLGLEDPELRGVPGEVRGLGLVHGVREPGDLQGHLLDEAGGASGARERAISLAGRCGPRVHRRARLPLPLAPSALIGDVRAAREAAQ